MWIVFSFFRYSCLPEFHSSRPAAPSQYSLYFASSLADDLAGSAAERGTHPTFTSSNTHPGSTRSEGLIDPIRNAENKLECPHCNKTYLLLRHLKRHLLRHMGERPYQCHLCKDTFPRSDVLRRHFQKCTIRRGNPAGQNYLANSQSHLSEIPLPGARLEAQNPPSKSSNTLSPPFCSASFSDSMTNPDNALPWVPDAMTARSTTSRPSSRASSAGSTQSQRGRSRISTFFRRSSSAHSKASSGYEEIVLDANPTRSSSQTSALSGRRGPTGNLAKATMNAIKKVGAFWRCKILRKTVSATITRQKSVYTFLPLLEAPRCRFWFSNFVDWSNQ
ncbi:uncharacterized protein BDZ99DRAFT_95248 [Mytilinidion resinicola]|uniref:C2H2-type domain-containing protein n=1 Tax=Mytilinidion resinicola TaxID=574789 RepID=A0A6A6YD59_9PEZI|nr:uncharacterized protein BDZ99DRAFT_95248 [Mytilinidion resinicola]KAF2806453.1 hypothetical protein BDZ99DRAFT_95248 [Mytilinidion resinicola]